jgi:hypothetical protein
VREPPCRLLSAQPALLLGMNFASSSFALSHSRAARKKQQKRIKSNVHLKIALVHVSLSLTLASTIARGATPCVVLHASFGAFSMRLKLLSRIILVSVISHRKINFYSPISSLAMFC